MTDPLSGMKTCAPVKASFAMATVLYPRPPPALDPYRPPPTHPGTLNPLVPSPPGTLAFTHTAAH